MLAASSTDDYISLSVAQAGQLADSRGEEWRVVRIDGIDQFVRLDFRGGRLNFEVENGLVTAVLVEGNEDFPVPEAIPPRTLTAVVEAPEDVLYVRDGVDVVDSDGSVVFRIADYDERLLDSSETPATFIESVHALSTGQVLVGLCCEPASGLTISVSDGETERLSLTGSFPAVSPDGANIATSDLSLIHI